MNGRRGSQERMVRLGLDRDTADRLLSGRVVPDDAPPGYDGVARVLTALRAPATDVELGRLDEAVAAAIGIIAGSRPAPVAAPRRPARHTWTTRVKLVALAVLGLMVLTSGLAAAGVLPDPAQNLVSDVLSKVGIHVPSADDRPAAPGDPAGGAGPAGSTADPNLPESSPAGGSNEEDADDEIVPPNAPSGTVPSPPHGSGTGRADEVSGGNSEHGTTVADERSGGHSSAGSDNSQGSNGRGQAPDRGNGPPADRETGPLEDSGPPGDPGNGSPPERGDDPPPRGDGGSSRSNRP